MRVLHTHTFVYTHTHMCVCTYRVYTHTKFSTAVDLFRVFVCGAKSCTVLLAMAKSMHGTRAEPARGFP